MKFSAVILAAGKGVRMVSRQPKVVHQAAGKPMICHIADAVKEAGVNDITVVVGHSKEIVQEVLADRDVRFAVQEQQLGTGHALMQAEGSIDPDGTVLVLTGDTPLLRAGTIKKMLDFHQQQKATATILSAVINNPYGYGRILRNPDNSFDRVVEEKDAREEEKKIQEINSGIYCFDIAAVFAALKKLGTSNAQGEYYLTDVLEILKNNQRQVAVLLHDDVEELYGVNDRVQLSWAENKLRQRKNIELMENGVTIMDPRSTYIDKDVIIGRDTIIYPNTIIEGQTEIGESCEIGPSTRINSSVIGHGVVIETSRIKQAQIDDDCNIGPFAYLRPETVLKHGVKVGDFVEIKKSVIGVKSKIPHLSYVGDALVGEGVNIGAGTITCNYDGKNKYQTILEDKVFIGSNTNLVAPVTVKRNSMTGAGSTITRDVPEDSLAIERAPQKVIKDWKKKKED
ncbi:MAG: bifunctional UDP-N-acetylglucosamine diphosphorylase/glucosamine-1-phosphate N-acetyltransferase GlmU [Syntrophomonadaceae bacterium]|nr:bifunctional UDP-N-acetylglucosamine diphosphorylase/glucosamine-1-phosphate N-acetyltransferase GlmU [Syntrophomonadaceae bacterium]